jgi:[acyl-carrier-protein] S-malonyltransferase
VGKIAFVFAGQGAQYPGMGKELYEASPAARKIFDRTEAIRPGTMRQCFEGSAEELAVTENTQPCLFAMDSACAAAAVEKGIVPDMCAGFSLGETAAVAFTRMLPFEKVFAFVQVRAAQMQACAEAHPGFMAAVLRLESGQVVSLCQQFEQVYPVNFNAPGQVVVSGAAAQKDSCLQAVLNQGGRAMLLKVGGAFHSPFMSDAAQKLQTWLQNSGLNMPEIPLYANRTALPYNEDIVSLLSGQVDHPVLWEQTVRNMASKGADLFVELGPGTVLSGLIRKILPDAGVCHVENTASLLEAAAILEGRNA